MRRWIVWVGGAAVLGLVAWYFGKPAETPVVVIAKPQAAVAEAPKAPPPKVLEVIDLARAYEPVPEPDELHPGGVNPATFIQLPAAAERIPPARDGDELYADVIRTVREAPMVWWRMWGAPERERIDVRPREVQSGQSKPVRLSVLPSVNDGTVFVPQGIPYTIEPAVWDFIRRSMLPTAPAPVRLHVIPREVDGPTQDLLHFPNEFGWM